MSIAAYLAKLSEGVDSSGILAASKGGTGTTSGGTFPTISAIDYGGDGNDTATDTAGGKTVTLTGSSFAANAKVLINGVAAPVVTVVNSTTITFTTPAMAAGSYVLYVVNANGSTAIAVPGISYSGVPAWSTAAGTIATTYETQAISTPLSATSNSAVTYSLLSGSLPPGAILNSNGTISGTSAVVSGPTTYTFTVRASDAELQDTDRQFSIVINPDVVTWVSPASASTITVGQDNSSSTAISATTATGNSIASYSADTLPTGLVISGSEITGTPTTLGTTSTTLTATSNVTGKTAQVTFTWTVIVGGDTYFPLTTLLLNAETAATPFAADASTNNFNLTVAGDTRPSNFGPYQNGYYSNYFDGTGDSIQTPTSTAFNMGAGDFTIEGWWNFSVLPSGGINCNLFTFAGTTTYNPYLYLWGDGTLALRTAQTSGNIFVSIPSGFVANTWYHLALVRSGNTYTLYKNGVSLASGTSTSVANENKYILFGDGAFFLNGYMSNIRVVKGVAVYTGTFTVPTSPLQITQSSGTNIAAITGTATSLLTCQSNRLIDASTNAFAITKTGDVKVSSFDPFVPDASYATLGSTYFNGTSSSGSLALTQAASNAIFPSVNAGGFTIEFWFFPAATSATFGTVVAGAWTSVGVPWWEINCNSTGFNLTLGNNGFGSSSGNITSSTPFAANQWTHVVVQRRSNGTNWDVYQNGVNVSANVTSANNFNLYSPAPIRIGYNYGNTVNANLMPFYLIDFRITNAQVYSADFIPPTSPSTAINNTRLLTCQTNQPTNNSMFVDNSTNNSLVTRFGSTTQGSFSPYGANWSNYFDGTGDYLSLPSAATTYLAANPFTIETWVCPTATSGMGIIARRAAVTARGFFLAYGSITTKKFSFYAGDTNNAAWELTLTSTNTFEPNQWHHVAVTRNASNVFTLWVNGVAEATATVSFTIGDDTSTLYIGSTDGGGSPFTGYISNLRLVQNSALYTSAFTPSTTPLTQITNTGLLTCQSYNLIDNSLAAATITKAGDVSVQKFNPFATVTQTPQTHSVYFNNSTSFATPVSAEFTFGTGAFTIEAWVNPSVNAATIAQWIYGNITTNTGNTQAGLTIKTDGTLQLQTWNAALATTTAVIPLNTWTHVAASFDGTTYRLFVNGVLSATGTTVYTLSANGPGTIGHNGTLAGHSLFTGHISNARVVKGTAVYTANFTPATTPLTAISGTVLLTCQDATIRDNSVNQFTLTATNSPQPRQQNPFGSTTSAKQEYSTSTFGGSAYFDGSSDYISIPNSASHATLPGDFSAECWFYLNNVTSSSQLIFSHRTNGYCPFLIWAATTNLQLYVSSDNSSWNVINGDIIATVAAGQWYHLAYTRTGSTFRVFLNGIQVKTFSNSASFTTSNSLQLGMSTTETNSALNGYISDFRFVKGTGVYTANFVPPTAPLTAVQNTTLLLNMDKSAIADKSSKLNLETWSTAQISTTKKKYGNASIDLSSGSLVLSSPVYFSGNTDFTIECWININSFGVNNMLMGWNKANYDYVLIKPTEIGLNQNNTYTASWATSLVAATWYHLAITRSSGVCRCFINGVKQGSDITNTADLGGNAPTQIGNWYTSPTYPFNGYIDDFRITKGYARYTANFTPPSSALITK